MILSFNFLIVGSIGVRRQLLHKHLELLYRHIRGPRKQRHIKPDDCLRRI